MSWYPQEAIDRISDTKIGNQYWFKDYFVENVKLTLIDKVTYPQMIYGKLPTLIWYHKDIGYLIGEGNEADHTKDLQNVKLDTLKEIVKSIEEHETN